MTKEDLVAGLWACSLRSGRPVLLHSSLRSFGYVEGGASTVVRAFLEVIGTQGTLVVPTLTGRASDGPSHPPDFDREHTPGWTGRIAETVRQWPGAVRSLHPTHSVAALGRQSSMIVADHEKAATPCGIETPYHRVATLGGQIVLCGVDWNQCTSVHGLEEVAHLPLHMQPGRTEVTMIADGQMIRAAIALHGGGRGVAKDFNRLAPKIAAAEGVHSGYVGKAWTTVIDAEIFWAEGLGCLQRDPALLLCNRELLDG